MTTSLRNMLSFVLGKEGYQVEEAQSGSEALKKLKGRKYDLVISDIRMPDLNGIELLKKIKTHDPELPVIMITAYAATHDAIEAMKLGAEDYIMKPFNLEELKIIIDKSLHKKSIELENIELKQKLSDKEKFENIVGGDPQMTKIYELIRTVAQTDSTVLISGESGTGKELIARAIHAQSPRSGQRFVSINCGALPENLLESELFGHKKGAFTDAYQEKEGLFEAAGPGHAVPGRDLGDVAEDAGQAAARHPGKGHPPRGRQPRDRRRRAHHRRHQPRPGREHGEGGVPLRPVLPPERDLHQGAAAARAQGRHPHPDAALPAALQPEVRQEHLRVREEGHGLFLRSTAGRGTCASWRTSSSAEWPWKRGRSSAPLSLPSEVIYNLDAAQAPGEDWAELLEAERFDFNEYIDDLSKRIIVRALELSGGNVKKTAQRLQVNYRSLRYLIEKYKLKYRS